MVGIDIVLVSRVKDKINMKGFYNKILTESEQNYIQNHKKTSLDIEARSVSGFFAAKEAILKAFGVGITNGYGFLDINIDHVKCGAPVVKLSEKLNMLLKLKGKTNVSVSISHDGDYATAIAILN